MEVGLFVFLVECKSVYMKENDLGTVIMISIDLC